MKTLEPFKTLDRIALILGAVAILGALCTPARSAGEIRRKDKTHCSFSMTTSSTTPEWSLGPQLSTTTARECTDFSHICWVSHSSTTLIHISSFSTTDETSSYAFEADGDELCRDWGPNVPWYIFHGDAEGSKTVYIQVEQ